MSKKKTNSKPNPMWGGRFSGGTAELMQAINASIDIDKALYKQDIRGSIAHARMLGQVGIISAKEAQTLIKGLQQIEGEITAGKMAFDPALEDIHMHIETRLKAIVGDVAGKLHTARSRNDQVATSFRLYVRDAIDEAVVLTQNLQRILVDVAEQHAATIMPGFTHFQPAQPVTFGHHLLAYVEMLGRDLHRFQTTRERINKMPLGAAALAGTSFPVDRQATAKELGFDQPMANSLDAVADRDFALDYLYAVSVQAMHLSRLAEELILWSTPAFGFVTLPESFTSGSSIMPQKRNPDAAELVRAKTGRITGNLVAMLQVLKALPLAYNKDMQEDKEPVFDSHAANILSLRVMAEMIAGLKANPTKMQAMAAAGYSTATDLADWLVQQLGMPFRQAHHVTGSIVKYAEDEGIKLMDVPLKQMQKIEKRITKEVYSVLSVEASVASRKSYGGTSAANVKKAIKEARKRYGL